MIFGTNKDGVQQGKNWLKRKMQLIMLIMC